MLLPLTSGHLESVSRSVIVRLFVTPRTAAHQASLSFTISQSLLKFMSIKLVMPQPSHPLLSPSPPTFNLSQRISSCIRWPKYWRFSFNISLSNEYPGLISFYDWLVWSPCSARDSARIFSKITDHSQKSEESRVSLKIWLSRSRSKASILWVQPSLWSSSHIHTWLLEKS